jgi:hypothetical protein
MQTGGLAHAFTTHKRGRPARSLREGGAFGPRSAAIRRRPRHTTENHKPTIGRVHCLPVND